MRIYFERSGGFAGMVLSTTVDTDTLPQEEAVFFQTKFAEAGFFDLPDLLDAPGEGVDRFHYRLSAETVEQRKTVEFGETAAPEQLRPVLERLSILARSPGR